VIVDVYWKLFHLVAPQVALDLTYQIDTAIMHQDMGLALSIRLQPACDRIDTFSDVFGACDRRNIAFTQQRASLVEASRVSDRRLDILVACECIDGVPIGDRRVISTVQTAINV